MLKNEVVVLGGGCFWCVEAAVKMLAGVVAVASGYAGGAEALANYQAVSSGQTEHAEVVRVEFDPTKLNFRDLLAVFFAVHDPTTLNRQGSDVGRQYRSVIFYTTDEQQQLATEILQRFNATNPDRPAVTEVAPLVAFFPAESYHQDYYAQQSGASYCQLVIDPKIIKIKQEFSQLLKPKL